MLLHEVKGSAAKHLTGYLMLLYSRLTSLVTTFEFSMFSLSPSHAVSVSDPHTLRLKSAVVLPQDSAIAGAPFQCHSTISCIAVQPTEYHTRPGISSADPDHNHLAASIEFYKLFMLPSDLSIRECLYVGRSGTRNNDPRVFPQDQLIKSSISRSATVVTDDRFVVLDDEAAIVNETEDVSFDIIGTCGISKRLATGRLDHSSAEQWTVDSEAFYGLVAGSTSMRLSKVTSATLEERNSHLSIELVRERLNDKLNSGARSIESL